MRPPSTVWGGSFPAKVESLKGLASQNLARRPNHHPGAASEVKGDGVEACSSRASALSLAGLALRWFQSGWGRVSDSTSRRTRPRSSSRYRRISGQQIHGAARPQRGRDARGRVRGLAFTDKRRHAGPERPRRAQERAGGNPIVPQFVPVDLLEGHAHNGRKILLRHLQAPSQNADPSAHRDINRVRASPGGDL